VAQRTLRTAAAPAATGRSLWPATGCAALAASAAACAQSSARRTPERGATRDAAAAASASVAPCWKLLGWRTG